jgi:demethylmenaquinone methyltransferase/2-methoxy-6-polyprenyl-1,4-benzoquinol methylase
MTTTGLPRPEHERVVRTMFDRIAPRYDLMNRVMTAGLDRRWRRLAADAARLPAGARALDLCCGTGDLTLELARRVGPEGLAVGSDFSADMLERARAKAGGAAVRFEHGNALELPYEDASFDAVTVAFGIRNVADVRTCLAEMVRCARPGGRVVVLEICTPKAPVLKMFYEGWFDRLVPLLGRLVGRDADAYSYLPASVRRFPAPSELAHMMVDAGLRGAAFRRLAGGIVALHWGTRP